MFVNTGRNEIGGAMMEMHLDCRHLQAMTDNTGIIQFCKADKPDSGSGYTADDNARALLVSLKLAGEERRKYSRIYANFLHTAQRPDGGWRNWKINDRFVPGLDSEDSLGRALLACSAGATCDMDDVTALSRQMVVKALPAVLRVKSPRAMAYSLIGMIICTSIFEQEQGLLRNAIARFGDDLIELYHRSKSPGWRWFEDRLTYCNGIFPHALFAYYAFSGHEKALQVAQDSLGFLADGLFRQGYLSIVGNNGWWLKGQTIPPYDQQPVDACSTALACLEAYRVTGKEDYRELLRLAGAWYWGKNINNMPLYNLETGGCHDALVPGGVNLNQGAEAVISMLLTSQALMSIGINTDAEDEYRQAQKIV